MRMLDKLGISPIDVSQYIELRGHLFDRPCALHYDGILVARLIQYCEPHWCRI